MDVCSHQFLISDDSTDTHYSDLHRFKKSPLKLFCFRVWRYKRKPTLLLLLLSRISFDLSLNRNDTYWSRWVFPKSIIFKIINITLFFNHSFNSEWAFLPQSAIFYNKKTLLWIILDLIWNYLSSISIGLYCNIDNCS